MPKETQKVIMHESMHASIQVGKDIYFYHRLKIPISTLIVGNLK